MKIDSFYELYPLFSVAKLDRFHTANAAGMIESSSATSASMTAQFPDLFSRKERYTFLVNLRWSSGNSKRWGNLQFHWGSRGMAARPMSSMASRSARLAGRMDMTWPVPVMGLHRVSNDKAELVVIAESCIGN